MTTIKQIIELNDNVDSFALLVIDKGVYRASLQYYWYDHNKLEIRERKREELEEMKEWSQEIIIKAMEICDKYDITLWKY